MSRQVEAIVEHKRGGAYEGLIGHPNIYELLYLVPKLLGAKTSVEIGTEYGNGACMMGSAMRETGGVHHTVDVNECLVAQAKVRELGLTGHVRFHEGKGQDFLKGLPESSVDFLFEDSSHTYENTLECLEAADRVLRVGGVLMVHDLNIPDVPRAIEAFLKGKPYLYVESTPTNDPGFGYLLKEAPN